MITVASLVVAGVGPTQARMFADPLLTACSRFDINTPGRMGHFVGQCMVESRLFQDLEENCRWSDPERIMRFFHNEVRTIADAVPLCNNPQAFANFVYANKNGNGDVSSGDGWNYRGRGLIDVTGRANYDRIGTDLARPYIASPELVALPDDAALTAAAFWSDNGLNALADANNADAITRRINGPTMDQRALRAQYAQQAIQAFQ